MNTDIQRIHSSLSHEWYTPAQYIESAREVLGDIDLDPASCALANDTVLAGHYFTAADDGLRQSWFGRVYLNPPYGKVAGKSNQAVWAAKLRAEFAAGHVHAAILLVNASIGDGWFNELWSYPMCMVSRRIRFESPTGQGPAPTKGNCFVYFGNNEQHFYGEFSRHGKVIAASEPQTIHRRSVRIVYKK